MKRSPVVKICLVSIFFTFSFISFAVPIVDASRPITPAPSYSKWSRLAIKEAKKRYPVAQIQDFHYLGSAHQGNEHVTKQFKLWLKTPNKEFGLFVNILIETKTERITSISFTETVN